MLLEVMPHLWLVEQEDNCFEEYEVLHVTSGTHVLNPLWMSRKWTCGMLDDLVKDVTENFVISLADDTDDGDDM
jgi:hypothetical protein